MPITSEAVHELFDMLRVELMSKRTCAQPELTAQSKGPESEGEIGSDALVASLRMQMQTLRQELSLCHTQLQTLRSANLTQQDELTEAGITTGVLRQRNASLQSHNTALDKELAQLRKSSSEDLRTIEMLQTKHARVLAEVDTVRTIEASFQEWMGVVKAQVAATETSLSELKGVIACQAEELATLRNKTSMLADTETQLVKSQMRNEAMEGELAAYRDSFQRYEETFKHCYDTISVERMRHTLDLAAEAKRQLETELAEAQETIVVLQHDVVASFKAWSEHRQVGTQSWLDDANLKSDTLRDEVGTVVAEPPEGINEGIPCSRCEMLEGRLLDVQLECQLERELRSSTERELSAMREAVVMPFVDAVEKVIDCAVEEVAPTGGNTTGVEKVWGPLQQCIDAINAQIKGTGNDCSASIETLKSTIVVLTNEVERGKQTRELLEQRIIQLSGHPTRPSTAPAIQSIDVHRLAPQREAPFGTLKGQVTSCASCGDSIEVDFAICTSCGDVFHRHCSQQPLPEFVCHRHQATVGKQRKPLAPPELGKRWRK